MYLNGQGVPEDHVLAYAWTAVTAERGYPQFVAP
jgi:TPR repeat protein